ITSAVRTTARGSVGIVTSAGTVVRISALELPTLPPTDGAPNLSGGAPLAAFVELPAGALPLALTSLSTEGPGLALGTRSGVVKRVNPDYPANRDEFEVISLRDDDEVVGAVDLSTGTEDLVFVTDDAQLLHFGADAVRPQGRSGGGIAGIKLASKASVVGFWAVDPSADNVVVTVSGSSGSLPGTQAGSVKVTPYAEYPAKGRATGGVRCHRFLRGEDTLLLAWAGPTPPMAASGSGVAVDLPDAIGKRDGSGIPAAAAIAAVAGRVCGRTGVGGRLCARAGGRAG